MNIEDVRMQALQLANVEECFPFGEETLVFKTSGKIFLLAALDEIPGQVNVKCDPDLAVELREQFASIIPGYHMNKKHWNTIILDGSVPIKIIKESIQNSYDLVAKKKKGKQ